LYDIRQETERVHSYNPGARTGRSSGTEHKHINTYKLTLSLCLTGFFHTMISVRQHTSQPDPPEKVG